MIEDDKLDLLTQMNWRYAVKDFTNENLSDNQANTILEAIRLSASSAGVQPYKLIVVEDQDTRVSLGEHSFTNKDKVINASQLLVFAIYRRLDTDYTDAYIELCAKERGIPIEVLNDYRDMLRGLVGRFNSDEEFQNWARPQAYIALGNFLTSCAVLGIDACPMEGFIGPKYDEILGLEEKNLTTAVLGVMGFRDENDAFAKMKKVRWPMEDFLIRI